jgi:hypothetical protein
MHRASLNEEKGDVGTKHLEIDTVLEGAARTRATYYTPQTDEERALDKKVNRKLDWIVLSLLAIEFIFCGIDKTNVGFVATSSFPKDANLKPDDIPNSLSLVREHERTSAGWHSAGKLASR